MKKYININLTVLILLISIQSWSQIHTDSYILMTKLKFHYYDDPTSNTTWLLNNADVRLGNSLYKRFSSNTKMVNIQKLVEALMKDPKNGGDAAFQKLVSSILRINNKPILIHVWNDTSKINGNKIPGAKPSLSNGYVWPSGAHYSKNEDWGGYFHLGAHYANNHGEKRLKETFLHELMHTQDKSFSFSDSYIIDGRYFGYGQDNDHYGIEAIPNKRLAFTEAIADVSPLFFSESEFKKNLDWFNKNGDLWVEKKKPKSWKLIVKEFFGAKYHKDIWLYDQIKNHPNGGEGNTIANNDYKNYRAYKIKDLPAKFTIHNERIMAMIFAMTAKSKKGIDHFIAATTIFNKEIAVDQNQDPFALFVGILSRLLLEEKTIAEVKKELDARDYSSPLSDDIGYDFILPIAYTDYFTSYALTSKSEFKALFNNEMNSDLIDIYWDHFRERIPKTQNGKGINDLIAITRYCRVK